MMRGYKVGIFDCDVYGPSLPVMVRFQEETPRFWASRVRRHGFVDVFFSPESLADTADSCIKLFFLWWMVCIFHAAKVG